MGYIINTEADVERLVYAEESSDAGFHYVETLLNEDRFTTEHNTGRPLNVNPELGLELLYKPCGWTCNRLPADRESQMSTSLNLETREFGA